jgi:hypothetical protein
MSLDVRRAVLASCLLAFAASVEASQRTFVASDGLDTSACTRAAPCRSFATAIAQTDNSGEVIVLDSAGYGSVTIAKSVSIVSPAGVYAGISVLPGNEGVTVDSPGVVVTLRGLTINGQGGTRGIDFVNGAELHVDNCLVSNMGSDGIRLQQGLANTITDTTVRDNVGNGINVAMPSGTLAIERVRAERNAIAGVFITSGTVSVRDSAIVQNEVRGLWVELSTAVSVNVGVSHSELTGNGLHGVFADASMAGAAIDASIVGNMIAENGQGAGVRGVASTNAFMLATGNDISRNATDGLVVDGATLAATGNTITRNANGLVIKVGATLRTRGDNTVTDNTNNVVGSPPPPLPGV